MVFQPGLGIMAKCEKIILRSPYRGMCWQLFGLQFEAPRPFALPLLAEVVDGASDSRSWGWASGSSPAPSTFRGFRHIFTRYSGKMVLLGKLELKFCLEQAMLGNETSRSPESLVTLH